MCVVFDCVCVAEYVLPAAGVAVAVCATVAVHVVAGVFDVSVFDAAYVAAVVCDAAIVGLCVFVCVLLCTDADYVLCCCCFVLLILQ